MYKSLYGYFYRIDSFIYIFSSIEIVVKVVVFHGRYFMDDFIESFWVLLKTIFTDEKVSIPCQKPGLGAP